MGKESVQEKPNTELPSLVPVLLGVIAIPLALLLWCANVLVFHLNYTKEEEMEPIPPTRWLASITIPLLMAGFKKKSVNKSGAISGFIIGFFITLSSYCFLACLMTFFILGSKVTKFKSSEKKKFEKDFKEGGQRNWIQVICNAGMATFLAVLYILDYGSGELAVNFSSQYRASWLSVGILGAFACSNGDTWASELGSVLGGQPFLITTFKQVPKGTNGGITMCGLLVSFLGGLCIGISHYLVIIYCVDVNILMKSPPQWPLILIGGLAGLLGSIVDSIFGATLQFSGLEKSTGCIIEHSGEGVIPITGNQILDNHSVNLLSTILMGYMTPVCAKMFMH
ncbi:hypothetical protein RUM43_014221 [Polyplax serrata]|uniref:Transmembrane protein 19 n=1 Tax=Polyplax serrata TaxID=468196 RepID=A0AAN8P190_POLSC